jgi:hypothetical protein
MQTTWACRIVIIALVGGFCFEGYGLVDAPVASAAKDAPGKPSSDISVSVTASLRAYANNARSSIIFDGELFDTADLHDNVVNNTRITVPAAGKFLIIANVSTATYSTEVCTV